ncbi:response regulator transcription factor [Adlercreutzia sp. ZJ141]|uniref:response regulator transcription factor n=1 Tax=Adlercreutzia sp. ZJ141 TaxID=2709406 RepID=UPI0013EC4408|nr:response regulator transcription factor [Adlercreutzia sp. ZJ141]
MSSEKRIEILLIEDDDIIAEVLQFFLSTNEEYVLTHTRTAEAALMRLDTETYDVVLLDILLPDDDGVSVCKKIRTRCDCPVIFISCLDDDMTIVKALEAGGDDYLVKPFDNAVLNARIRANLRRRRIDATTVDVGLYESSDFILDARRQMIIIDGDERSLTPIEFRVLKYLMTHPNKYMTSKEIYEAIWGSDDCGDARTVFVHICNIRRKIERDPSNPEHIKSVWGKGYTFT